MRCWGECERMELLGILIEFEKLIAVLDGISASRVAVPTFH